MSLQSHNLDRQNNVSSLKASEGMSVVICWQCCFKLNIYRVLFAEITGGRHRKSDELRVLITVLNNVICRRIIGLTCK
jgi:hypothetical protein